MNELEMFEAYMKKEHPFIDTVNGAYEAMWNLWQARVPEGYVVVPKEPSAKMIDDCFELLAYGTDNNSEKLKSIYKYIVESEK